MNETMDAPTNQVAPPPQVVGEAVDAGRSAMPLVSVIVRSVDRPELDRALASVAAQTYPNIEVILVNALGDAHRAVEARCGTFPVRVVGTGQGLHRSRAANMGLEAARGAYLIFLDDDDWFAPHHVADLAALLERDAAPVAAYAVVDCVQPAADGEVKTIYRFDQCFDPVRLLVENYIPMHAILFRRGLVEQGCRIDESLDVYEDWDFWIQLSRLGDFVFHDRLGAYYWIAAGSGFGVVADQQAVECGLAALFAKWRARWSGAEVLAITRYAKHFSMYHELVVQHERHDRARAQAHAQQVAELELALEDARRALVAANRRHSARLVHMQSVIADQQRRIAELLSSTSWRLTMPLRVVQRFRRAPRETLGHSVRYLGERWRRLPQQALLGRVAAKLRGRPYVGDPSAATVVLRSRALHALRIEPTEAPSVSVIIHADGDALGLFNCVKSIVEQDDRARGLSLEVVLAVAPGARAAADEVLRHVDGLGSEEYGGGDGWARVLARTRAGIVVFVEPQVMLQAGCIARLVETLERRDDAALVGAQVLDGRGRLRSAGLVVWLDGNAQAYGAGDVPDAPEYRYLRRVDACDAGCFAVRRACLAPVTGWASDYESPRYRAVDLSLRAAESGSRVLYQPEARAVESGGPSIETESALERQLRQVDREHLVHRWAARLGEFHGVGPQDLDWCRDAGAWRRVLVVDALLPMPDQDSGSLRMFSLIEELAALGVKVVFAGLHLDHRAPYREMLERIGVEVLCPPRVFSVVEYLKIHGDVFDAVVLSRVDVAAQLADPVRACCPSARLIFDTVDLHFLREERMAALMGDSAMAEAARARREVELGLMRKADVTLVVSRYEQDLLTEACPDVRVEVVSNIHDVHGLQAGYEAREGVLFIGGFNHPPNEDAVLYYVNEIAPLVRRELGPVKTWIVGSRPTAKVLALASDEVIVEGFVEDISGHFNRARLTVAPLRYGAGVKGKVNMSMAYGVPAVVTPIAAEGMALTDGVDVAVGEDAEAFARAVVEVYRDRELWARLSANGMRNIETHFSRAAARETMRRLLDEVAA